MKTSPLPPSFLPLPAFLLLPSPSSSSLCIKAGWSLSGRRQRRTCSSRRGIKECVKVCLLQDARGPAQSRLIPSIKQHDIGTDPGGAKYCNIKNTGEEGREREWEEGGWKKRRCEVPAVSSPLAAALYQHPREPAGRPPRLCPAPPLKQPPPGEQHSYPR
ncbi:hypothetical protein E2C01_061662 [Portunus trituberculatus]|uniref:Uncharacterized protein n=1 Tax=Portunus trituberculatus TaxID=210409 RepID=A0A5B7HD05_PORTR|nr:hypothetical protein [Portunus trituberculatus]